jgi:phosphoribosylglycinamide formyltransferase 1
MANRERSGSSAEAGAAMRTHRLAVMLSGSGRTLINLQKAIDEGRLPARIVLVIASRECLGAERARGLGIETVVEGGVIEARRLEELLVARDVEWVALAGYLKLVRIPERYRGRFVNIHPALLPKYGGPGMHGLHVHEAVIKAGEKESGCTVHLCDEHFDTGDIVLQKRCPVMAGDTAETLAARVFGLECEAYPEALGMLFAEEKRIANRE